MLDINVSNIDNSESCIVFFLFFRLINNNIDINEDKPKRRSHLTIPFTRKFY